MRSVGKFVARDFDVWEEDKGPAASIDLEKLITIGRRQWRVVALSVTTAVVIAVGYILTAVPLYTASTAVLIDSSQSNIVSQMSAMGTVDADEASTLSQVELLRSDTIAGAVVNKLNLVNDPTFNASSSSPVSAAIGLVKGILNVSNWFAADIETAEEVERRKNEAISKLVAGLEVSRVGRTAVLEISYTSPSAGEAARIVRAIADAYLVDKLESKYDATRRASIWLQERIDELKQKAVESDLAVQKFRAENGLVTADGRLVSDQQLTELNSALIVAQADVAKAQARYDRIKTIIDSGRTDAIVTDVLDSSISNDLRKKYLEASKLEAEISNRLGPNHVQAVRLRSEMSEFQRLMFEELGRIAESYQSEVTVAQSRLKSLQENVTAAQGASASAGESQVQLRELERAAESYRSLYQTFLQRFQEATQQQSFPVTDARVISKATIPENPSHPRKPLILAFGVLLGLGVGGAIGAFREFRDRFFRTGDQIRDVLDVEYLGSTPLVAETDVPVAKGGDHPRNIRRTSAITSYVLDHPLSMFAETLRSTKIAVDLGGKARGAKVIGMISTLPGEGKSTVAINFAELLAMQGAKTLLIDADLRNPGATRAIGRHAEAGLLEALIDNRPIRDLLLLDPKTKLAFLPAVVTRRVPHSSELLASQAMHAIIESAKDNFDYIILDLPPLAPVVDARAVATRVYSFVYVIEWGKTSRKAVVAALFADQEIMRKCAGAVLNKVDEEKMKLYRTYGSSEYYYSRYSSYYNEN